VWLDTSRSNMKQVKEETLKRLKQLVLEKPNF
jgi:hypothetical protein